MIKMNKKVINFPNFEQKNVCVKRNYVFNSVSLRLPKTLISRGARDSKIGKKWPESSRILDYILC